MPKEAKNEMGSIVGQSINEINIDLVTLRSDLVKRQTIKFTRCPQMLFIYIQRTEESVIIWGQGRSVVHVTGAVFKGLRILSMFMHLFLTFGCLFAIKVNGRLGVGIRLLPDLLHDKRMHLQYAVDGAGDQAHALGCTCKTNNKVINHSLTHLLALHSSAHFNFKNLSYYYY